MRLHLKNISPEVHGMITEHKASHNHKNLDDTVTCLIKNAMQNFNNRDIHEDSTALIRFHLMEIDRLKVENCKLRTENDKIRFPHFEPCIVNKRDGDKERIEVARMAQELYDEEIINQIGAFRKPTDEEKKAIIKQSEVAHG